MAGYGDVPVRKDMKMRLLPWIWLLIAAPMWAEDDNIQAQAQSAVAAVVNEDSDFSGSHYFGSLPSYGLADCSQVAGAGSGVGAVSVGTESRICKKIRAEIRARARASEAFGRYAALSAGGQSAASQRALERFEHYTEQADRLLDSVLLEMDDESNGFRSLMAGLKRKVTCPVLMPIRILGDLGC